MVGNFGEHDDMEVLELGTSDHPGGLPVNTEQSKQHGDRKEVCKEFSERIEALSMDEKDAALWEALTELQGCEFHTAKGLSFTYNIKGGELFVNRKEKSITQSSAFMAFHKALELEGNVPGPKKLGTFGASYLYPVFVRIGVVRKEECF